MFTQFAMQGAAADAELFRGQRPVAFALGQGTADEGEFGFPEIEGQGGTRTVGRRGGPDICRQVAQGDFWAAGHDHAMLDGGPQLTHIARPFAGDECFHRLGGQFAERLVVLLGRLAQEMLSEERDILAVVAQWWKKKLHDVETEEEILSEFTFLGHFGQVAVGGGKEAHLGGDGFVAADAFEDAFAEDAEDFDLGCRVDLADFIEEKGATRSLFEASDASFARSGKCAFLVPEEFAFE